MVFQIQKWDPSTLGKHPRILLVGRSGSGKSVALMDILSYLAESIDYCLLFSPTTDSVNEFRKVAPASCVFSGGLNLDVVETALRINRENAERKKARELFVVADDVAATDKKLLSSPVMRDGLMNGRHACCGWAVSLQYVMDVPVDARSQFQIVVVCAENNQMNRRRIWQQFAGVVPTYRQFDAIMASCTQDHSCLVIDNSNPSATIQSSLFHWKARLHPPPYKLCRSRFWNLDATRRPCAKPGVLVVDEKATPRAEPKMDRRTMEVVK